MTRPRKDRSTCEGGSAPDGVVTSRGHNVPSSYLGHEVAQLTKLRSEPNRLLSRVGLGKSLLPVSPVMMLAGRESNYSGRGRFSSADSCHVLSRYLPVNGPRRIDQMNSRAYVSQFSADGSLFVAGFQVCVWYEDILTSCLWSYNSFRKIGRNKFVNVVFLSFCQTGKWN